MSRTKPGRKKGYKIVGEDMRSFLTTFDRGGHTPKVQPYPYLYTPIKYRRYKYVEAPELTLPLMVFDTLKNVKAFLKLNTVLLEKNKVLTYECYYIPSIIVPDPLDEENYILNHLLQNDNIQIMLRRNHNVKKIVVPIGTDTAQSVCLTNLVTL